jgi:glycine cleavage system H protein
VIPTDRQYLESHEWAKKEGDLVALGITDFAVKHLTDLVFIKLPVVGDTLRKGDRFGEIESVKAVSDLVSPVDGEVVEVNSELVDALDRVANDPYGAGWMVKVRNSGPIIGMLDAAAYQKVTDAEGH